MGKSITNAEKVYFHRRADLPGSEVRTVVDTVRTWRCYSTDYEFLAPLTWCGDVWHRRREAQLGPGTVLAAHPGEVFAARKVHAGGTGSSLTIDSNVLAGYLEEHGVSPSRVHLRPFTTASPALQRALSAVFDAFHAGATALEAQSNMVELMARIASEALDRTWAPPPRLDRDARAAERVLECLHEDASANIDLAALARETGLSRFQALRAFKRRFGLPPHAYQLRIRLGLAQKALRDGKPSAHVAADFGFVDQSHLTRHFKRLIGLTPGQYARLGDEAPRAPRGPGVRAAPRLRDEAPRLAQR